MSHDDLYNCGSIRTYENCLKNYNDWCLSSGKKKDAKNFGCCINTPELHLILSAVNILFEHMKSEIESVSLQWTKQCNVERHYVYGSPRFAGNACKTLLNKIDIQDRLKCLRCVKYVDTFKTLKKLDPNCQKYIDSFKEKLLIFQLQQR